MRFLFCVLFCLVAQSGWALDRALVGKWSAGAGDEVSTMEIKADGSAVIDGTPFTLQAEGGKMKLAYQPGVVIDATYAVSGPTLMITMLGETEKWQRIGAAPAAAAAPANPAPAPVPTPAKAATPVVPAGPASAPADGNWLRRPDEGYDILLPGDFRVLGEKGGGILLGSNVTPGLILVFPSAAGTAADLERAQKQGIQEETISMSPRGAVREAQAEGCTGKVIEVAGTLEQTQVQGLLGAYLRTEEMGTGGMAILAATTPASWPKLQPMAEQVLRGVRFYKPQISDRLLKARQALAGHSLVTSFNSSTVSQNSSGYYTGTATNSFRAWHCCSSGRCRYEGARSTSFQGGGIIGASESGPGSQDGTWELQAQGNDYRLTFHFDGGGSASWTISLDANENVYVDGTRVKVTTDSICNQL